MIDVSASPIATLIQNKSADLIMADLRVLDGRLREPEVRKRLPQTRNRRDHRHQPEVGGSQQSCQHHRRDGLHDELGALRGERQQPLREQTCLSGLHADVRC